MIVLYTTGCPVCKMLKNKLDQAGVSYEIEEDANKMIDLRGKKAELTMDLQGLNYKLETMTANAQKANDAGVSVTINHTQTDATGKTEVVIGNSQRAHRGMTLPGGWLLPFCAGLALAVLASRLV